jgi:hypothetical protein
MWPHDRYSKQTGLSKEQLKEHLSEDLGWREGKPTWTSLSRLGQYFWHGVWPARMVRHLQETGNNRSARP